MCGIVGYVGQRPARGVVVDALRRMEYRGYDSAGRRTGRRRRRPDRAPPAGRLANLEAALAETAPTSFAGTTGMGHTRWATHGAPTDRNAHPHRDATGTGRRGPQRHHRELRAAARRAGGRRGRIRQRHRHRGRRAPGRRGSTATAPTAGDFAAAVLAVLRRLEGAFTLVVRQRRRARTRSSPRAAPRRWWSASATARCSSAPTSRRSSSTPARPSNWARTRSS